jgi:putative transposase
MLVFEFKTYGKVKQFAAIDEAIRTTQFIYGWITPKQASTT